MTRWPQDGCISSVLRWTSSVYLSTVRPHTQRPQQTAVVQGDVSDFGGSSLATGVVSRTPEAVGGSSSRPSVEARSTQAALCPSVSPASPRASSSLVETVQRFTKNLGPLRPVACQLALFHHSSSRCMYQHR